MSNHLRRFADAFMQGWQIGERRLDREESREIRREQAKLARDRYNSQSEYNRWKMGNEEKRTAGYLAGIASKIEKDKRAKGGGGGANAPLSDAALNFQAQTGGAAYVPPAQSAGPANVYVDVDGGVASPPGISGGGYDNDGGSSDGGGSYGGELAQGGRVGRYARGGFARGFVGGLASGRRYADQEDRRNQDQPITRPGPITHRSSTPVYGDSAGTSGPGSGYGNVAAPPTTAVRESVPWAGGNLITGGMPPNGWMYQQGGRVLDNGGSRNIEDRRGEPPPQQEETYDGEVPDLTAIRRSNRRNMDAVQSGRLKPPKYEASELKGYAQGGTVRRFEGGGSNQPMSWMERVMARMNLRQTRPDGTAPATPAGTGLPPRFTADDRNEAWNWSVQGPRPRTIARQDRGSVQPTFVGETDRADETPRQQAPVFVGETDRADETPRAIATAPPAVRGGNRAPRPLRGGGLGDQQRETAYDPVKDFHDPRNTGIVDALGGVNQRHWELMNREPGGLKFGGPDQQPYNFRRGGPVPKFDRGGRTPTPRVSGNLPPVQEAYVDDQGQLVPIDLPEYARADPATPGDFLPRPMFDRPWDPPTVIEGDRGMSEADLAALHRRNPKAYGKPRPAVARAARPRGGAAGLNEGDPYPAQQSDQRPEFGGEEGRADETVARPRQTLEQAVPPVPPEPLWSPSGDWAREGTLEQIRQRRLARNTISQPGSETDATTGPPGGKPIEQMTDKEFDTYMQQVSNMTRADTAVPAQVGPTGGAEVDPSASRLPKRRTQSGFVGEEARADETVARPRGGAAGATEPDVPPQGIVTAPPGRKGNGANVPAGPQPWKPLRDKTRTEAFDPIKDRADPDNVNIVDDTGRVNPQQGPQPQAIKTAQPGLYTAEGGEGLQGRAGQNRDLSTGNATKDYMVGAASFADRVFGSDPRGTHALYSGHGAPDEREVNNVLKAIDPKGTMPVGQRLENASRQIYDWYMSQGDKEGAERASFEMTQYGVKMSTQFGKAAADAAQKGDIPTAINMLQQGYGYLNNGQTANYDPRANLITLTDDKGNVTMRIPADEKTVKNLALGMATGQLGWGVIRAGAQQAGYTPSPQGGPAPGGGSAGLTGPSPAAQAQPPAPRPPQPSMPSQGAPAPSVGPPRAPSPPPAGPPPQAAQGAGAPATARPAGPPPQAVQTTPPPPVVSKNFQNFDMLGPEDRENLYKEHFAQHPMVPPNRLVRTTAQSPNQTGLDYLVGQRNQLDADYKAERDHIMAKAAEATKKGMSRAEYSKVVPAQLAQAEKRYGERKKEMNDLLKEARQNQNMQDRFDQQHGTAPRNIDIASESVIKQAFDTRAKAWQTKQAGANFDHSVLRYARTPEQKKALYDVARGIWTANKGAMDADKAFDTAVYVTSIFPDTDGKPTRAANTNYGVGATALKFRPLGGNGRRGYVLELPGREQFQVDQNTYNEIIGLHGRNWEQYQKDKTKTTVDAIRDQNLLGRATGLVLKYNPLTAPGSIPGAIVGLTGR